MKVPPIARAWGDAIRKYYEGQPIILPGDGDLTTDDLIGFAQRTHLLEWFDYWRQTDQLATPPDPAIRKAGQEQRAQTLLRNRVFKTIISKIDPDDPTEHPYFWLKGAGLIRDHSLPRATRRHSDLDLLIKKKQLPYWHHRLRSLGFEAHREPEWNLADDFHPAVSSTFYYGTIEGQEVLIDLHWHLTDFPARRACGRWGFSMDTVFEESQPPTMDRELRILYWIDHAFSHNFYQWKFILDILTLIRSEPIDAERLHYWIDYTGYEPSYRMGWHWMKTILGHSPPLPPPEESELTRAEQHYLGETVRGETRRGRYLWMTSSWLTPGEKFTFFRTILFPPPEIIPGVRSRPGLWKRVEIYGNRLNKLIREGFKQGKDYFINLLE